MEIIILTDEYRDYVINIVMDRWDESIDGATKEVYRWINNEDNSICFIGLINGIPMSTAVFETHSTVDESIPCWNTLLWVEPQHRGKGYGSLLTEKRFEYARKLGYKTIYLDTLNARDYHLKMKFDWKIINEFDKDNNHYIIMSKDL